MFRTSRTKSVLGWGHVQAFGVDSQDDETPTFVNRCLGTLYISEIAPALWENVIACIENSTDVPGPVPDIVRAMLRPDAITATMRMEVFRALAPHVDQKA